MKIFIYLFICFFMVFQSCGDSNQKKLNKEKIRINDSIEKVRQVQILKEQTTKDSIAKVEQDKVIGEITFGITKEQFELKRKEFLEQTKFVRRLHLDGTNYYGNKMGSYSFRYLNGAYYNNKLYFAHVYGNSIHYEKYNTELKPALLSI